MKQPDVPNIGDKKDVASHRLKVAKEDFSKSGRNPACK